MSRDTLNPPDELAIPHGHTGSHPAWSSGIRAFHEPEQSLACARMVFRKARLLCISHLSSVTFPHRVADLLTSTLAMTMPRAGTWARRGMLCEG